MFANVVHKIYLSVSSLNILLNLPPPLRDSEIFRENAIDLVIKVISSGFISHFLIVNISCFFTFLNLHNQRKLINFAIIGVFFCTRSVFPLDSSPVREFEEESWA